MRLAWMIPDVGHYHHARLQEVARIASVEAHLVEAYVESEFAEFRHEDGHACGYARHSLGFSRPTGVKDRLRIRAKIREELDWIDADVICVQGWADCVAMAGIGWAFDHKRPIVLASDSSIGDFPRTQWKEAVKSRIVRLCSAGFAGGTRQADYLCALGMARESVIPGYAAVDNEHFQDGAERAQREAVVLRSKLGLPERYFLASGRLVPKKNFSGLLRAYASYRACAGNTAWQLVLLGDGPLREPLRRQVRELDLCADVSFQGFQPYPALPAYYGLAGAFIHASTTEQWGLVVNEAMAAGLPVIVSNRCGCAEDLVEVERNGYVFDPYDLDALAERMCSVSSDGCDRRSMGEASRRIVQRRSMERWAASLRLAAEHAMTVPPRVAGLLDRALVEALVLR